MKRPESIEYWLDDTPPFISLLFLSFQQVLVTAMTLVLVTVIYKVVGIGDAIISSALSWTLLVYALSTFLQSLRNAPIGCGFLAPPATTAIFLHSSILALKTGGMPCLILLTMLAGAVEFFFSFIMHRLRYLLTPVVIGMIVLTVGYVLGIEGVRNALAIEFVTSPSFSKYVLAGIVTTCSTISFAIWGKGSLRSLCLLLGVLVGCILSIFLGLFSHSSVASYLDSPFVTYPSLIGFEFQISYELIFPFVICGFICATRSMGSILSNQQLNDASWSSPDFSSINKGVRADGLCIMLAGLLGTIGINLSPSSVGLAKITGATSRSIAYTVSIMYFIMAFLPKVYDLFLLIPLPVAGGALLINASFMILAGIRIMTVQPISKRGLFITGMSLLGGMSFLVFPDFYQSLPFTFRLFTGSALSITTIIAVILTLTFRFGIRLKSKHTGSEEESPSETFISAVEKQFKRWDIPLYLQNKIRKNSLQIISLLEQSNIHPPKIKFEVSYDEVQFDLVILYDGPLINIQNSSVQEDDMLEEDSFAEGLTKYLNSFSPDEYKLNQNQKGSQIAMTFYA